MVQGISQKNKLIKNVETAFPSLFEAFLQLKNEEEAKEFLSDLCTPKELHDLEERWKIACLLDQKKYSHRQIGLLIKVSTTTTVRVARFLNSGNLSGYRIILDRFKRKRRRGSKS